MTVASTVGAGPTAARYLFPRLSPVAKLLFPPADMPVLPRNLSDDGAPIEPSLDTHGCPAGLEDATGRPWPCAAPDAPVDGAYAVLTERAYLDPATALAPAATSFPPFVILAVPL